MASFNPSDLSTITAANLKGLLPVQIINILNQSDHPRNASQSEIVDAQRTLLIGTSLSMVTLRQRHANNTIARVPMFAEYDGSFWARPTIGLKRTFSPRLTQIVADD
ncbi:small capsid protein-like protein [Phocid alphaherpesvirus 1]|uniref:Small capsomere-interacting protein n=1 Tax=Phocid alphaherpesvirus 1 TaxID=47418 RepID=A0A482F430_9ALPH|nr:small capsid protein-like protein [Phocid alphaherpesvirus 1]QBN85156.1 small capsid protein-like protein [Phocid alphaherpesvirus 1]UNP64245.1 small capsid protein-like protein [Phocid alphaherpesvirus 1]